MSKVDNGGPAFPQSETLYEDGAELVRTAHGGMTLRDWFAAQASEQDINHWSTGWVASNGREVIKHFSREEARYRYADAMLAARPVE